MAFERQLRTMQKKTAKAIERTDFGVIRGVTVSGVTDQVMSAERRMLANLVLAAGHQIKAAIRKKFVLLEHLKTSFTGNSVLRVPGRAFAALGPIGERRIPQA